MTADEEEMFSSSTGGVAPAVWDRLADRHFYSTSCWLEFCAQGSGARSGALVGGPADTPDFAVPVAEMHQPASSLYSWPELLARAGLPAITHSALMLGPQQGYQTHLLAGPSPFDTHCAGNLLGRLEQVGRADACIGMYLGSTDALTLRIAGVPARPVFLDAEACFDLAGHSWESWLDQFSYKRQLAIRRERTAFERAGYRIEHLPLADAYHELAPLALATQARYGLTGRIEDYERMLAGHVRAMGDRARVAVCRIDDSTPTGFCVYYEWCGVLYLRWAGFDYARLHDAYEYFNLVYYTHIERAAETGVIGIDAGVKAIEAKVLRGAALRPRWLVDLSVSSPLAAADDQVRAWNAAATRPYQEDPRLNRGLDTPEDWRAFG